MILIFIYILVIAAVVIFAFNGDKKDKSKAKKALKTTQTNHKDKKKKTSYTIYPKMVFWCVILLFGPIYLSISESLDFGLAFIFCSVIGLIIFCFIPEKTWEEMSQPWSKAIIEKKQTPLYEDGDKKYYSCDYKAAIKIYDSMIANDFEDKNAYKQRMVCNWFLGNKEEAFEDAKVLITLESNNPYGQAIYNFMSQEYKKALEYCNKVIELEERLILNCNINDDGAFFSLRKEMIKTGFFTYPYYNLRGDCYKELGIYNLAVKDYQKVIGGQYPFSAISIDAFFQNKKHAIVSLANCYYELGDYDNLYNTINHMGVNEFSLISCGLGLHFEQLYVMCGIISRLLGKDSDFYFDILGYLYNNQFQKAITILDDFIKLYDDNYVLQLAHRLRGFLHYCLQEDEKALQDLETVIKIEKLKETITDSDKPSLLDSSFYRMLATINDFLGNVDLSVKYCNKAIELSSNSYDEFLSYSLAAHIKGIDIKKQIQYYTKAIKIIPYPMLYLHRGTMYHDIKEYEKCIKDIKKVKNYQFEDTTINTTFALYKRIAYIAIYDCFDKSEHYAEGIKYYTDEIKTYPNALSLYEYRARLYIMIKDLQSAINDYEYILQVDPNMIYAYWPLSMCYSFVGNNRIKAREILSKGIELDKDNTEKDKLYEYRARMFSADKKWQEAIEDFSKAIELKQDYKYYVYRATCYNEIFEKEKAREDIQRAIEIKGDNDVFSEILGTTIKIDLENNKEDILNALGANTTKGRLLDIENENLENTKKQEEQIKEKIKKAQETNTPKLQVSGLDNIASKIRKLDL